MTVLTANTGGKCFSTGSFKSVFWEYLMILTSLHVPYFPENGQS